VNEGVNDIQTVIRLILPDQLELSAVYMYQLDLMLELNIDNKQMHPSGVDILAT
jgi:hypothetical protein